MKRIVAGLVMLLLAALSFADTVIYSHSHSGFRTTLTAKSDSVSKVGSVYYYRGPSLSFFLYKYETSGWLTREWWVRVTGTAGTYVSDSATNPNVVTVPFTITGNETLTVRIRNNLDGTTDSTSFTFRIDPASDTTLPSISISRSDESFWLRGPVTLQATATDEGSGVDEDSWQYRLDGGAWQAGSSATVDGDGEVAVEFRVANEYGNFGTQAVELFFDKNPPEMTVTEASSGWTSQDVTFSITSAGDDQSGTDPDYPRVAMTGAQPLDEQKVDGPVSVTVEGETTLTFTNRDNAGHEVSATRTVRLDKTAPAITLPPELLPDLPTGEARWTNQTTFVVTVADPLSGLDDTACQWTAVPSATNPGTNPPTDAIWRSGSIVELPPETEGGWCVWYRARDLAGNQAVSVRGEVRLDVTPPMISIGSGWSSSLEVSASAVDAGAGTDAASWRWSLNGAVWQNGSTALMPASGSRPVWFQVADVLGNLSTKQLTAFVDSVGPEIAPAVVTPGVSFDTWTAHPSVEVDATFDDPLAGLAGRFYSLDGGAGWLAWPGMPVSISTQGVTELAFRAVDAAGNEGVVRRAVKIDRTAPELSPGALADGYVRGALSFSTLPQAGDPLSGLEAGQPGRQLQPGRRPRFPLAGSLPVDGLAEGEWRLYLRARDRVGNLTRFEAGHLFTVDRTPPRVTGAACFRPASRWRRTATPPPPRWRCARSSRTAAARPGPGAGRGALAAIRHRPRRPRPAGLRRTRGSDFPERPGLRHPLPVPAGGGRGRQ